MSIGERAFYRCVSLINITVDENNPIYKSIDGNLYTKDGKTLIQYAIGKENTSFVIPDSVTTIGNYSFEYCDNLMSVTISDSVTVIGDSVFERCNNLTNVTIGNSVKSIGFYAFAHCYSMTSITIPDSVETIGWNAFSLCNLTSVTIGNSVKSIGLAAFYGCKLTSVTFNNTSGWFVSTDSNATSGTDIDSADLANTATAAEYLKSTYHSYFWFRKEPTYSEGLDYTLNSDQQSYAVTGIGSCTDTELVIPPTYEGLPVTSIGEDAFREADNITNVIIGDNVTNIGRSSFYCCDNLVSVVIGDNVKNIEGWAFVGCYNLTTIVIPDSVTSIGEYAFLDCTALTNVTIGNGVTTIGYYAFYGCDNLVSVTFNNTSGWFVSTDSNATSGTDIASAELANKVTAAEYLKSTYYNYYWFRREAE